MGDITLNHITKIEGHAWLDLKVEGKKLLKCELGSVEGSRYFEPLLRGRSYEDAPEITSRICGICSSAHGVVSVMAMENALGIEPSSQTLLLRELQTLGERFRSHATHLYFLALPDYLGYESALSMLPKYVKEIQRALRLVKLGNDLVTLISGRVMHQVSTTIGGFTHFPTDDELAEMRKRFEEAKKDIEETGKLFASLPVPTLVSTTDYFSLTRPGEYATSYGDVRIGEKVIKQKDYASLLKEYHEEYSNANFVVKDGKSYYVGSLARINNNHEWMTPEAKAFMKKIGFKIPCLNHYHNNLCQAIELIEHRQRVLDILTKFPVKHEKPVKPVIRAGHGIAANEAPRGTLWHEYQVDDSGHITYANVVTPTAQLLRQMQDDIAVIVQKDLDVSKSKEKIVLDVEKLIRSCDPCFSCATHFLTVHWH